MLRKNEGKFSEKVRVVILGWENHDESSHPCFYMFMCCKFLKGIYIYKNNLGWGSAVVSDGRPAHPAACYTRTREPGSGYGTTQGSHLILCDACLGTRDLYNYRKGGVHYCSLILGRLVLGTIP